MINYHMDDIIFNVIFQCNYDQVCQGRALIKNVKIHFHCSLLDNFYVYEVCYSRLNKQEMTGLINILS